MGVDDEVARRRMMLKIFTSRWRIIYKTNANWTLLSSSSPEWSAYKALEKFAAVPQECARLQDGRWSRR